MKLKHTKVATLAASIIAFGSLAGGANGALLLTFDDSSGDTVVTLVANDLDVSSLTSSAGSDPGSTFIRPLAGSVFFSGPIDTASLVDISYEIPAFTFGTGNIDSAAFDIGADTPHVALDGGGGLLWLYSGNDSNVNFTATATYSGTLADNGIDGSPQTITFANGEQLRIDTVPEPSSAILFGLGALGFVARRRRIS